MFLLFVIPPDKFNTFYGYVQCIIMEYVVCVYGFSTIRFVYAILFDFFLLATLGLWYYFCWAHANGTNLNDLILIFENERQQTVTATTRLSYGQSVGDKYENNCTSSVHSSHDLTYHSPLCCFDASANYSIKQTYFSSERNKTFSRYIH